MMPTGRAKNGFFSGVEYTTAANPPPARQRALLVGEVDQAGARDRGIERASLQQIMTLAVEFAGLDIRQAGGPTSRCPVSVFLT